jgi:hypothetical protein
MKQPLEVTGIFIEHCGTCCANHCRFCIIGNAQPDNLPMERFAELVERFDDWRKAQKIQQFDVVFNWMRAANWSMDTAAAMMSLHHRVMPEIRKTLFMGGIEFKSDDDLKVWLAGHRELGADLLWVSLAGSQEMHDRWVGRKGDYEFNMKAIRLANELGYTRGEVLFLTKSTLPLLEDLLDTLDVIPGREWRKIRVVHYRGRGKHMMHERITKEDLQLLSKRVLEDLQERDSLRTEIEWIRLFQKEEFSKPLKRRLLLSVTESNIADLEAMTCDEILADLEKRTREVWALLPDAKFLSSRYGVFDSLDTRLYPAGELERIWVDRYLSELPNKVERELTTWTNN